MFIGKEYSEDELQRCGWPLGRKLGKQDNQRNTRAATIDEIKAFLNGRHDELAAIVMEDELRIAAQKIVIPEFAPGDAPLDAKP